jgi:hypothetical protein
MEGLDDDVGLIAEAFCNLDDHSRSKTDEPFFVSDLTWCVPYAYSPTPPPPTSCVDDATWCYGSCSPNDCAYVAQKLKRCKAKNTDGVRTALEACPATCGTCSVVAPTPTREPTRRPAPEATPGPTPGPAPRAPSPTQHPTPTPYHPTPTYAPSASCADDATWSYGTKASNTCAYVARKLKRCKAKNTDGIRSALEACPSTCGTC